MSMRAQLADAKTAAVRGELRHVREIVGPSMRLTTSKPTLKAFQADCARDRRQRNAQVAELGAQLSQAFKNRPEAMGRIRLMDQVHSSPYNPFVKVCNSKTIMATTLDLDEAVDEYVKDRLTAAAC